MPNGAVSCSSLISCFIIIIIIIIIIINAEDNKNIQAKNRKKSGVKIKDTSVCVCEIGTSLQVA